ncbi:MAG: hypothetical protein ACFFCO_09725 [Promethearchaeota archaeon]
MTETPEKPETALQEEIRSLQSELEKTKRAHARQEALLRKTVRDDVIEQLIASGEFSAGLQLLLQDLRQIPIRGKRFRDHCENLRSELETMVDELEPEAKTEETELKSRRQKSAQLTKKLQEAREVIGNLEEQIKYFDRIHRDLTGKMELLASRGRAKRAQSFLGGLLIFFGGILLIAGLLLEIATTEFPFIYSMFDSFFNFLLIILGILMVGSGFLHQT